MTGSLAAFLAVAVVVIVTPGQDTVLTIRNTLRGGRRSGFLTGVGVATGQAAWTLAASFGITALLVASPLAFTLVRYAGAAYIVWLGLTSLRDAWRGTHAAHRGEAPAEARGDARASLRQGLISNLGNPKMAVFFTSLLPQFTPAGAGLDVPLRLGLLFCTMTLVWLTLYAIVVARAGDVMRRPRVRRAVDAAAGTVLVGFGVKLLAGR